MSVDRRARVHSALGEPSRLSIVDLLVLSDLSVGELADRLGLPGNLLAHHLRVLEEAGVIDRVRSEGDRRRTYVRLRTEDPAVASAAQASLPQRVNSVVFVCTQNSARSQLAAAAWQRSSPIPVRSGGLRPAARVHPSAVRVGHKHGLDLNQAQPQAVGRLRKGDLVVAVCDQVHEELGPGTRLHWSIKDPVRVETLDAFERALDDLLPRIARLSETLNPRETS